MKTITKINPSCVSRLSSPSPKSRPKGLGYDSDYMTIVILSNSYYSSDSVPEQQSAEQVVQCESRLAS